MIPIKWFQSAGSREPDRNGGGAMIPIKWFQSAGSREPDRFLADKISGSASFNPQARESLIDVSPFAFWSSYSFNPQARESLIQAIATRVSTGDVSIRRLARA